MTIFTGFSFEDPYWQKFADDLDLSESNMKNILEQYGDLLPHLLMGAASPMDVTRLNELSDFMGFFASTGHPFAVAVSCFTIHGGPFAEKLPVPINQMDVDTRDFLVGLFESNKSRGNSKSGGDYLQNNHEQIREMANSGDVEMQFLLGLKIYFDGQPKTAYREWFEKSALGGYERAYYHTAGCLDGDDDDSDRDWSKAAYWNYQGAKVENSKSLMCCYNLGVMYAKGDFVEKNTKTASFYLSLVYRNAHKTEFPFLKNAAIDTMKELSIEMQQPPYLLEDREMDPKLAEFSNVYSRKK